MMIHTLCKVDEIPLEGTKLIEFFGRTVHVYWHNGQPVAVANTCMHFGGPLEFTDGKLVCPWHDAAFGLDGQRLRAPAPRQSRLMFLSTRVDGDDFNYVWGE